MADRQKPDAGKSRDAEAGRFAAELPAYELSSYEPVEFEMPAIEIGDEQVEAQMRAAVDQMGANYVEADPRETRAKDTVRIDLEVTRDGETVKGISSKGRLLSLGEGFMPIDFDRALLGMRPGAEREFDFDAPDPSGPSDASEHSFHAKVKLQAIMEKKAPEFTDEWVREHLPPFRSAEEFRAQTRREMEEQAARSVEQEKNMRAVQALTERFDEKIEDRFYEATREEMRRGWEAQARRQGMDLEDFIGKQGMNEQQFSMMLMMQVRETLVQGYSLDAWARHYGIEPTDEDVAELANMMSQGHAEEFIEHVRAEDPELEGMKIAARRYAANKDLVARAKIR